MKGSLTKIKEERMKIEDYKKMTQLAIANVAPVFKPKELLVLYDFARTVTQEDIDGPNPPAKVNPSPSPPR
jgi:hypothetical protein